MAARKILFFACLFLAFDAIAALRQFRTPVNPYIQGPAPLEAPPCTRRNGCLTRFTRVDRRKSEPIAKQVGKGQLLGVTRDNGFPPDGINSPVNRWLTDIPSPPPFSNQGDPLNVVAAALPGQDISQQTPQT